jgi:putative nucleotidyltransferase with HDIG domain
MADNKLHIKRLVFSIAALVDLGQETTSTKDVSEKMRAALYVITGMLSVPTAALFIYHRPQRMFDLLVEKGHREKDLGRIQLGVQAEHIKSFRINDLHTTHDFSKLAFFKQNSVVLKELQVKIFLPLFAKGELIGAITLGKKLGGAPYRQGEKTVLKVIAQQMAITLSNAQLFRELAKKAAENRRLFKNMQRIYHDTIQAFAAAIDAKDVYTKDHSYRVASYAVAIAKELGWKKKDVEGIYVAGLLHDIGKIIIDTKVINKGEKLSAVELSEIKKHPQISYDILSKVKFPWKNVDYFVRHHHERMDGKGYPDALRSTELSDGVKILALADAFDAMTTDRPYRDKMSLDEAFQEVRKCCGTQFDEKITQVFFNLIRRELNGEVRDMRIVPHLPYGARSLAMAADPAAGV